MKIKGRSSRALARTGIPKWSPTGEFISSVDRDGASEIYVIRPDGTDLRRLTVPPVPCFGQAWSPDGSRLAFACQTGELVTELNIDIYLVNIDGSNLTRLTEDPAVQQSPVWSRDGATLMWESFDPDGRQIIVANADGSDARPFVTGMGSTYTPAWSPDGALIAFVSEVGGNAEVYVTAADSFEFPGCSGHRPRSTGTRRGLRVATASFSKTTGMGTSRSSRSILTAPVSQNYTDEDLANAGQVAWRPAQPWSLTLRKGIGLAALAVVALVGVAFVVITVMSDSDNGDPPDRMIFIGRKDGDYTIRMNSTSTDKPPDLAGVLPWDAAPVWSPDGSQIAFYGDRVFNLTNADDDVDIYVMAGDGTGLTQLTDAERPDAFPVWSPDGATIAFYSERDGNGEIYRMAPDGSGVSRLTSVMVWTSR